MNETVWDRLNAGRVIDWEDPGLEDYTVALDNCRSYLGRINGACLGKQEYTEAFAKIAGAVGERSSVIPPFQCDLGFNIFIGKRSLINYNCVLLDTVRITIGDDVLIGPGCNIVTAVHPKDPDERRRTVVGGKPVTLGNDIWLGANVTILPGITIGDRSIIGAGSVVTKDVPAGTTMAGNPARRIT